MALCGLLVRQPRTRHTLRVLRLKFILVFPLGYQLLQRFKDPVTQGAASGALRLTQNTGQSAFFGEKYKLDKVCPFSISVYLLLLTFLHPRQDI